MPGKKKTTRKKTTTKKKVVRKKAPVKKKVARKKTPRKKTTKKKIGRPTKYRPRLCEDLIQHFTVEHNREITRANKKTGNEYTELIANPLPTLAGFAAKIHVGTNTLWNWTKEHPEFLDATTRAKALAESMLVSNALLGLYHPSFSIFVAKNYTDMRDLKEVAVSEIDDDARTPEEVQARIAEIDRKIKELEAQL